MKSIVKLVFLCMILFIGGCQIGNDKPITNPEKVSTEDLPDTRAMQDEFTRSFLKSTEEVEDGYYSFVSGINRYEMNFPKSGVIGEKGYSKDEGFEQLSIGIESSSYNIGITSEYISHLKKDNLETNISLLGSIAEDVDFQQIDNDTADLHYGKFNRKDNYGYLAYVQNSRDTGGILISYYIQCLETNNSCKDNSKEDEFLQWLKSIKFKEKELSENSA
ncbi:hypothetical protein [Pseudalkalibacillus sp. NRS-1564]|uniref:hypothetical protein n=1 Tax=Pseudalkalibacillus sp. NRS-1564 TaxID=3233900 RepID=UPI003D269B39